MRYLYVIPIRHNASDNTNQNDRPIWQPKRIFGCNHPGVNWANQLASAFRSFSSKMRLRSSSRLLYSHNSSGSIDLTSDVSLSERMIREQAAPLGCTREISSCGVNLSSCGVNLVCCSGIVASSLLKGFTEIRQMAVRTYVIQVPDR